MLAGRLGVNVAAVRNVVIWVTHSPHLSVVLQFIEHLSHRD
jgi:hypothetical protein